MTVSRSHHAYDLAVDLERERQRDREQERRDDETERAEDERDKWAHSDRGYYEGDEGR